MKQKLIVGLVVVVVLSGVLLAPFAAAFVGNLPVVDGTPLGRDARLVADGYALLYVIPHGDKKVALVDCGVDPEAKAIFRELQRRGLNADAVTHIFITHGHPDHTGGCSKFPKAEVVAMEAEVPLLKGAPLHNSPVGRLAGNKPSGFTVTRPLKDADSLILDELAVQGFLIPGHTDGSAAWLIDDVLYMGDSAGAKTSGIAPAPWVFSVDTEQNRASLKALQQRLAPGSVKMVAFGHTGPTADFTMP